MERKIESTHINSRIIKCKRFWAQQDTSPLGVHNKTQVRWVCTIRHKSVGCAQ